MQTRSPLLDAARLQAVGQPADVFVQLLVGDGLVMLGVVAFPDDGDLLARAGRWRSMQL
jgi:hypothetical protein